MVPYTDIVHLSSKAFHYDYWDRRAFYRRHKPLPSKVGSFQVFLQGFQGANRPPPYVTQHAHRVKRCEYLPEEEPMAGPVQYLVPNRRGA